MRVFLDFEASSLADDSFPIEVAWVFEDGRAESFLIKPAPGWVDWDPRSEAIHRVSRPQLTAEGQPHDLVARRMLAELKGHDLLASAPSWDGKWLSVLLRGARLPRHALRLRDSDVAQAETVRETLKGRVAKEKLGAAVAEVLAQVRAVKAALPAEHRALPDAERERQLWLEARRLAELAGLPAPA
jgi:hypothetical protein